MNKFIKFNPNKASVVVIVIIVIIGLVVAVGGAYWFTNKRLEEITEIKLSAGAPFSTATLIIDNRGNINYEASFPDAEIPDTGIRKKTDTARITKEQYNELVNLINKNNFFLLKESYVDIKMMDATSYNITVKRGKETKSVGCYGEYPEELMEIVDKIKELWGKEILEVGV